MFRRYVHLEESTREIADFLNSVGWLTRTGKKWESSWILDRLREEKYIGTQIYNRLSAKLRSPLRPNPKSLWITKANAFPAIVDPDDFRKAQERMRREDRRRSNEELLNSLRRCLAKRGELTLRILRRSKNTPDPGTYSKRFGSLYKAYLLIG